MKNKDVTICGDAALQNILRMTEDLYELAKQKVVSSQQVSQENVAALNNARKEIAAARRVLES